MNSTVPRCCMKSCVISLPSHQQDNDLLSVSSRVLAIMQPIRQKKYLKSGPKIKITKEAVNVICHFMELPVDKRRKYQGLQQPQQFP